MAGKVPAAADVSTVSGRNRPALTDVAQLWQMLAGTGGHLSGFRLDSPVLELKLLFAVAESG